MTGAEHHQSLSFLLCKVANSFSATQHYDNDVKWRCKQTPGHNLKVTFLLEYYASHQCLTTRKKVVARDLSGMLTLNIVSTSRIGSRKLSVLRDHTQRLAFRVCMTGNFNRCIRRDGSQHHIIRQIFLTNIGFHFKTLPTSMYRYNKLT